MKIILVIISFLISFSPYCQLQTSEVSLDYLVNTYIAGPGDFISNVTGNNSTEANIGEFSYAGPILQLENGILLTTGTILDWPDGPHGPNNTQTAGFDNDLGGNALFSYFTNSGAFDVALLEFDIVPAQSEFLLELVFGSEEYLDYVGTAMNDAVVITVKKNEPNSTTENIALTPSGNVLSVNTIHPFCVNLNGLHVPEQDPYYYLSNADTTSLLQYNGFTRRLSASANLTPGASYHVSIMIGDVQDAVFDSGLFIRRCINPCTAGMEEDSSNLSYSIYPNPSHGSGFIEFSEMLKEDINLSIINLDGSVICSGILTAGSIRKEYQGLQSGAYLIKIEGSDKAYTEKLIIQ